MTVEDLLAYLTGTPPPGSHPDTAVLVLAALRSAGYTIVELPKPALGWWDCYEDEGDPPDHQNYGDETAEYAVTTWFDHPGEVQISHQGEPLEPISPADARELAAALLAAADHAEKPCPPCDPACGPDEHIPSCSQRSYAEEAD